MKYTFCEKLMWFALAGPSFKYLEKTVFTTEKQKNVLMWWRLL